MSGTHLLMSVQVLFPPSHLLQLCYRQINTSKVIFDTTGPIGTWSHGYHTSTEQWPHSLLPVQLMLAFFPVVHMYMESFDGYLQMIVGSLSSKCWWSNKSTAKRTSQIKKNSSINAIIWYSANCLKYQFHKFKLIRQSWAKMLQLMAFSTELFIACI